MENDSIQVERSTMQIRNPVPGGRVHSYGVDASGLLTR